ncbi:MAG: tetratricopeptide repeat protein [Thermodesulfobacteriota bacterium]
MFGKQNRKLFFILTLFLPFFLLITSANSKDDNDDNFSNARQSFYKLNNTELQKSIETYKKILEKDANSAKAYAGIAEAYSFIGLINKESKVEYENEFNLAYENMEKALKLDPDSSDVKRALAYIYLNLNRPKEALDIANKLLLEDKENFENVYLVWAADGKKPEDARINTILQSNPKFILANYDLAVAYYVRRRDPARAIIHLENVLKISDSPYFRTYLGRMYRSKKALTRSIEEFDKALKMNPNYSFAKINKGISLHYVGKYKESTQYLLEGLNSNPQFSEAYFFLGSNYFKTGDKNNSLLNYNRFIKETAGDSKYTNYINEARKNISSLN